MQFSFWGQKLKAGEEHEIGRDTSDVFSNACLAGGKKAEVFVNGRLVCCLSTNNPQCSFSSKAPYDTPTVIRVEKGAVDVVGYTASIEIIEEDEDEDEEMAAPCTAKACTGCHSEKPKKKKVEKKEKNKKNAVAAPIVTPAAGVSDPYIGQPMEEPTVQEETVEAEQITIGKKKYFLHRVSRMLFAGSLEDAEMVGFYDPAKKAITQTPPDFTIDENTVMSKTALAGQKRVNALRAEWDGKYGDDESEVTIDSDEDAHFEDQAVFSKKRKLEAGKMYTRERGMSGL